MVKFPSVALQLCALVLTILFNADVYAASASDRLTDFFKNVQSLRAEFQQVVTDPRGKIIQDAHGTFLMQRPNKFRWNYQKPYEQTIVADGARLWVYDKDLEQVTVKKLDEALGNTPALLLSGAQPLTENFHIAELTDRKDGLQWTTLTPKNDEANFKQVRLAFGKQSLEVMELVDSFEQTTQLRFSSVKSNVKFTASEFQFTPPKGVDVVGEGK
jgi:outer membrane lipoprotein carrier protein